MDHWEMQAEQQSILDCRWSKQNAPPADVSHHQYRTFWKGLIIAAVFVFLLWIALFFWFGV